MAEGNRAHRRLAAALVVFSSLGLGCQSAPPRRPGNGAGLDEGPTRWLMLPDEARQYRRLQNTREVVNFVEAFWRRRDPDPDKPGNEFAKAFYERVEAADNLYSEGGTRGSLTDRGRALVLLGPPTLQRYAPKKVPSWDPGRVGGPPAVQTRIIPMETWVYPVGELSPALQQILRQDDPVSEVVLVFTTEGQRTELIDGERFLEMAARAALLR
jgi:GWxTD domain-containing protein